MSEIRFEVELPPKELRRNSLARNHHAYKRAADDYAEGGVDRGARRKRGGTVMTDTNNTQAHECGECHRPDPILSVGHSLWTGKRTPEGRGTHDLRDPACYWTQKFAEATQAQQLADAITRADTLAEALRELLHWWDDEGVMNPEFRDMMDRAAAALAGEPE